MQENQQLNDDASSLEHVSLKYTDEVRWLSGAADAMEDAGVAYFKA